MIYDISCKPLIGTKYLRISFDKIDGCCRVYDATRYLVLFALEKYGTIYNWLRYLTSQTGGILGFFLSITGKLTLMIPSLYGKY